MIDLGPHIQYIWEAHSQFPKEPNQAFRLWDGQTAYAMHPVWCACTILTETTLPEVLRHEGSLALLYHDVLEDTRRPLPETLSSQVKQYIKDMTFPGGFEEEQQKIWDFSPEIQLFKLYDKTSNLLDGVWMSPEKYQDYLQFTYRLLEETEKNWKNLTIAGIIRSLPEERK